MSPTFFAAIALLFVFEGLLPFLLPKFWRKMMSQLIVQNDRTLRTMGLISMLVGVGLLYFIFQ